MQEQPVKKTKQRQLGKTKQAIDARAAIVIQALLNHKTEDEAIKEAGYSDSYARIHKQQIINNPAMQDSFKRVLERAGLSDDFLSEKIRSLVDARETKFFATKGVVTDSKEVDALGVQLQATELAVKLKGHLRGAEQATTQGNTYIDLSQYTVAINSVPEHSHTKDDEVVDITINNELTK